MTRIHSYIVGAGEEVWGTSLVPALVTRTCPGNSTRLSDLHPPWSLAIDNFAELSTIKMSE